MTRLRGSPLRPLLALALLQIATAACGSTPVLDDRQAYLAAHPALAPDRAEAIAAGRVEVGMTMEQVRAAVGPPLHVRRSMRAGPGGALATEIWIYPGPVVQPSPLKSAANSEFLMRLEFVSGILASMREL